MLDQKSKQMGVSKESLENAMQRKAPPTVPSKQPSTDAAKATPAPVIPASVGKPEEREGGDDEEKQKPPPASADKATPAAVIPASVGKPEEIEEGEEKEAKQTKKAGADAAPDQKKDETKQHAAAQGDAAGPAREVELPTTSPKAVPGKGNSPDDDVEIEGEGQGECVGITGSEEGFWSEYDPGYKLKGAKPLRYHLKGCKLHRYTQEEARQCLKDRHFLFIGDSLTRYQYMSLVMFLEDHWPDDTGEKEGFNPCREAWGQGGWKVFYQTSSKLLKGKEICDCFRLDGPMSRNTQNTLVENRYFHLAAHNLSVTYLQLFGVLPMRGHWPTEECRNKKRGEDGCGPDSMSKSEVAKNLHVLQEEEYNTYLKDGQFDWTGNHMQAIADVVPAMGVDTLFINLGLWVPTGEYDNKEEIRATYKAARSAVVAHEKGGGMAFWKRTTTMLKCYKTGGKRCNPGDKREVRFYKDKEPVALAKDMGIGIYDTAEPTRTLPWWVWNDEVHFRPFVYRELNNLLFNQFCNSPSAKGAR
uniref:SGNH domain-containing protein n=2 Tax=Hemiselmis andersenii TaxID=464988 RepID=A0A6U4JN35_HEMAN